MKQKEVTVEVAAAHAKPNSSAAGTMPPSTKKGRVRYDKKAESEFFIDNSALAGFTGERILYMAVRELIENSLDSCETNHILPHVSLSLKLIDPSNDMWSISCQDNGIGIPSDKVPVAVCSFLTSGKYVEKQQRGLFGVGLKMIAGFSTKDTDQPIKVSSKSSEEKSEFYFELRTDIGTNKPIVISKKSIKADEEKIKSESGFRVEAVLRARLSPITKTKIYDYISQTSVINPYSILEFETDDGKVVFDRRTEVMPQPAKEVLPHPADMDLQILKKAINNFMNQKTTLQGILCNSFQKLSNDKAREIIAKAGLEGKPADKYSDTELMEVVKICKATKFHSPNTDHLSPIGEEILTAGMTSEYTIITSKDNNSSAESSSSQPQLSVKILKPALTAYSFRTCVVNNRPMIVECGIAYGGDISSFKLYRFANKIPLLYDEGSDVAREVVSEVEINKMGITKKEAKEQFASSTKSDRAVELLPLHTFFHICSTKIPYKTAGKESIASEGELKRYMKACLSDLYRKVSAQIRKELRMKDAQSRLNLYKFYIPLIVSAISESIDVDSEKLGQAFTELAERHVKGEIIGMMETSENRQDKITGKRIEEESHISAEDTADGRADSSVDDAQQAINSARKRGKLEPKSERDSGGNKKSKPAATPKKVIAKEEEKKKAKVKEQSPDKKKSAKGRGQTTLDSLLPGSKLTSAKKRR